MAAMPSVYPINHRVSRMHSYATLHDRHGCRSLEATNLPNQESPPVSRVGIKIHLVLCRCDYDKNVGMSAKRE